MAIGRISGPMLKSNLERQGVDLSIDSDYVYFDVNNRRIGINTDVPDAALDVAGAARFDNSISIAAGEISNIGYGTGDIVLSPDGSGLVVVQGRLEATQLLSNVTTGTAPLVVESTTPVANLTLELVDGAITTVLFNTIDVPESVPGVEDLEFGEVILNTRDGIMYTKRLIDSTEEIVKIGGSVPVENTLYVQKSGNDANDGISWDTAVASIERAVDLAVERNTLTLIQIGPGVYTTQGHIDVPDNTIIQAAHRSVVIQPEAGYEQRNVFRLGSGCFLEGPVFEGWQIDDLENPSEGFAACFRPGAVILRTPYVHKVVVRSMPTWDVVPPPLDRNNANPLVPRGAGVIIADGSVCSPYSIYPNIMAWGATPVSQNGIGYVAKNGGLINAVNAVSIWAHKHFYALDGGQIILSACSTQFGDFTMVSKGTRQLVTPNIVSIALSTDASLAAAIVAARDTIIDNMWLDLENNGFTVGWTEEDEIYTRRDAATFLQSVSWVIQTANEKPMIDFARGLFDTQGNAVFSSDKLAAFIRSFEFMRDAIKDLPESTVETRAIVDALIAALNATISDPSFLVEPSTITAIGHTWTAVMTGVALTKIPPARNLATIEESILELDQGVVIASGQDDQGSALFIGGMRIDADTGELSGPPFDKAVNRVATRAAIARSF